MVQAPPPQPCECEEGEVSAPGLSRRAFFGRAATLGGGAVAAGLMASAPAAAQSADPTEPGVSPEALPDLAGIVVSVVGEEMQLRPRDTARGTGAEWRIRLAPGGTVSRLNEDAVLADFAPGEEVIIFGTPDGPGSYAARRVVGDLSALSNVTVTSRSSSSLRTSAGEIQLTARTSPESAGFAPDLAPVTLGTLEQVPNGARVSALVLRNVDKGSSIAVQIGVF